MALKFTRLKELDQKNLLELENLEKIIFKKAALNRYHLPVIARYGYLFALFLEDNIVGEASFIRQEKNVFLVGLWIVAERRGKGLGSLLMSESIAYLKKSGFETVELTVEKDNTSAIKLYEKIGFRKTEDLPSFYGPSQSRLLFRANLLEY